MKELVPLPDNDKITVEYEELIGHEAMGKTEISIGKLRNDYSVSQLLDGIEKPGERGQRKITTIHEKIVPIVLPPETEVETKWYRTKKTWKIIAAVIAALIAITSLAVNIINILESKTVKGPDTKKELKQDSTPGSLDSGKQPGKK